MKKLYVIGNGFDLHHNLDTSYKSFADFLESNYLSIYDNLLEYYGFPDIANKDDELSHKDSMWHNFETNLSDINIDLVLENFTRSHRLGGNAYEIAKCVPTQGIGTKEKIIRYNISIIN